jgi:alkylation response protein AidB-like acyl-CoA dehydrogenase
VDTRPTAEQRELRRTARQLARDLGPATVADLDDETRTKRLAGAVADAGWRELRAGDDGPLASGVEAAIVAEELGAALADVAYLGPVLAADLARRAGITLDSDAVLAYGTDLRTVGADDDAAIAVDTAPETTTAYVVTQDRALARVPVTGTRIGADLTRSVRATDRTATPVGGSLTADDLASWYALGLALTSADLVGIMRGAIDLTVAYAADRKQFGTAVGSFQAVQHLLAEAHTLMEGSTSVAIHAAWAVDALDVDDALHAGRVAKAYCARAARTACETAIQVHGGIGNTWDCLAHVYLRRALLSSQWFGDDGVQLDCLQAARLGSRDGLS